MSKCKICGAEQGLLIDLGRQPLANKYPQNKEIVNEKMWAMNILICQECRCASTSTIIDRDEMFTDYYYLSSVNVELTQHFDDLASKLVGSSGVLDIGSNDGVLLRPLKQLGVRCVGIDPSENVGKLANDEGLPTYIGFFDEMAVNKILNEFGQPEHIVASSIFTHVDDPETFVKNLKKLSSNNTKVIIEIEYLLNLIENLQFERFYFDRPFYYTILAMEILFSKFGFNMIAVENIEPHGGSLRLTFSLGIEASKSEKEKINEFLKIEKLRLNDQYISEFENRIHNEVKALKDFLIKCKTDGLKVVGYGAPARLATITNYADITSDLIDFIVEDSKLKIGRNTPGKHIPILDSTELDKNSCDLLIVFAYEYIESIHRKTAHLGVPHYGPIPLRKLMDN